MTKEQWHRFPDVKPGDGQRVICANTNDKPANPLLRGLWYMATFRAYTPMEGLVLTLPVMNGTFMCSDAVNRSDPEISWWTPLVLPEFTKEMNEELTS